MDDKHSALDGPSGNKWTLRKWQVAFLTMVTMVCIACLGAAFLQARAFDWWGYGHFGVSNGDTASPIFFVDVRGVASTPTIVRFVRFADHAAVPQNYAEVSQGMSRDYAGHIRNEDRWRDTLTVVAGRTTREKVAIQIQSATARQFFARPGDDTRSYDRCSEFWTEHIAPHLPSEQGS